MTLRMILTLLAGTALVAAGKPAPAAKPGCTAQTRACLEAVARLYIDGLVRHDGSKIPLAANVRRTENALTNARGANEVRESFARTTMVEGAKEVRLYTDVAKGQVIAFFLLDVDLKPETGGGSGSTKAGDTEYKVAVTKPAGTYTVHEAERFRIVAGKITEIEIIAHVEDGKGQGGGWPVERVEVVKPEPKK
jgi:hypothetical protein